MVRWKRFQFWIGKIFTPIPLHIPNFLPVDYDYVGIDRLDTLNDGSILFLTPSIDGSETGYHFLTSELHSHLDISSKSS